jgi:hypothetical protein
MSAKIEEERKLMLVTFPSRVNRFDSKTKVKTFLRLAVYIRW